MPSSGPHRRKRAIGQQKIPRRYVNRVLRIKEKGRTKNEKRKRRQGRRGQMRRLFFCAIPFSIFVFPYFAGGAGAGAVGAGVAAGAGAVVPAAGSVTGPGSGLMKSSITCTAAA